VINETGSNTIGGYFQYQNYGGSLVDLKTGTFTAQGIGGDVEFTVDWDGGKYSGGTGANDLVLTIVSSAGVVIPEPAGLGLMGLALLAIRKRRS